MVSKAAANAVVQDTLRRAANEFGERLLAFYALGSLAHGGFSPAVSDVDVALVLGGASAADEPRVKALVEGVKGSRLPLADRLSLFWTGPLGLATRTGAGRLPPVDREDLRLHGVLLHGREMRHLAEPATREEMVVAAARLALDRFSTEVAMAETHDPSPLVRAGPRALTKRVLFPVRFLYTARTGRIGLNDAAVEHYVTGAEGPATTLAAHALAWRSHPFEPGDPAPLALATAGLPPLYRGFVAEYAAVLRELGQGALAARYDAWGAALTSRSTPRESPTSPVAR